MPIISRDVRQTTRALQAGRLVAFATETVYGLGGDAANLAAINRIYRYKNRPIAHPLIVHIADFSDADRWACSIPPIAQTMADYFMPGPLTILLPRADRTLPQLCGGGNFVALRVPSHPSARQLLTDFGGGIAAPSANQFGGISPTTAEHVANEFAYQKDLYILDGGPCSIGIESTIVGFRDEQPFILRPGRITAADITAVTGHPLIPPPSLSAPGTLARHYAPQTTMRLADADTIISLVSNQQASVGVLSRKKPPTLDARLWRMADSDHRLYAHNLYRNLRELDAASTQSILVEYPPDNDDWQAINNRLQRAAQSGTTT